MRNITKIAVIIGAIFCLLAASFNGAAFAYAENRVQSYPALLATTDNPYKNPDDPNTTKSGTCFSTNTMTGYFMEVKLSNQSSAIISPDYEDTWDKWSGWNLWKNKTHEATAILTFVDITYNNQPIFVSVFTKVKYVMDAGQIHPRLLAQEDFTEANDNAIRLPASYYNYLQYEIQHSGASLRRFNLTFMKNSGKDVMPLKYTQEVDVRLYTKDIPANSDDPTIVDPATGEEIPNPNFKLDNWAGIMSAWENSTGCSTKDVPAWFWAVFAGIVIFIGAGLLIRYLRWIFGKR